MDRGEPWEPTYDTVETARRKYEDRLIAQLRAELEMWNAGVVHD